jgi:mannose-1-phosphate guanylyltransferase
LTGTGESLLQATVHRLEPLVDSRIIVVTGAAHEDAVRAQLPSLDPEQVLAEPSARDSMAAIGLAAARLERQDPGALIGSFAADHLVSDVEVFHACVREAAEVAATGLLVTIGIEPTHPATGFGYIRMGEPLDGFETARAVQEFVEKPAAARATEYLATGEFRWNAGMFVARAATLLDLLERWHPELAAGLRSIGAEPSRLAEVWPHLEKIAIDHAVAEPASHAGRVAVVPGPFGWDDVGDFASLHGLLPNDASRPAVLGDEALVLSCDATGLVVPAAGRTVALLGVQDLVVVDTPDVLLVTTRQRAQDVKKVVEALRQRGRSDLT